MGMSMGIQEAIEHLNDVLNDDDRWTDCAECKEEHEQLREFLEELQQYRQIGTIDECRATRDELIELQEYRKLGTVKECLAEMEKQTPMTHHCIRTNDTKLYTKDVVCPSCLGVTRSALNEFPKYCSNCGQALKWED